MEKIWNAVNKIQPITVSSICIAHAQCLGFLCRHRQRCLLSITLLIEAIRTEREWERLGEILATLSAKAPKLTLWWQPANVSIQL